MDPKTTQLMLNMVQIISTSIQMAPGILKLFDEHKTKIQQLIDEEREPTTEEHEELNASIRSLLSEL